MRPCIMLFLVSMTGSAFGAAAASLRFIGFSADGAYFAWEQYGIYDGSGFPWSTLSIQSTHDSSIAGEFAVVLEDEFCGGDDARELSMSQAVGLLGELSSEGWVEGGRLVHHPPTDMTPMGDSVTFCTTYFSPYYYIGDFTLGLRTEEIPGTEMEDIWGFPPVTLSVELTDNSSGETRVVGGIGRAACLENWVFGYGIEDVWCLDDTVFAAAIQCLSVGFEGPDLTYRMVGWTL